MAQCNCQWVGLATENHLREESLGYTNKKIQQRQMPQPLPPAVTLILLLFTLFLADTGIMEIANGNSQGANSKQLKVCQPLIPFYLGQV